MHVAADEDLDGRLAQLLVAIRDKPYALMLDGSYRSFAAMVDGFDIGSAGRALLGLREWLVVRHQTGNNLAWPGLVAMAAFPDDPSRWRPWNGQVESGAEDVAGAVEVLLEFLRHRSSVGGAASLLRAHAELVASKGW